MGNVHYFQRYSQPENVATNNTLLLFSRFYQEKPAYLERLLHKLLDMDIQVGVSIKQQERGTESVPDGFIRQSSFEIIIESKTSDWFYADQLRRHIQSFSQKDSTNNILLAITKEITDERQQELKRELGDDLSERFKVVSFKQIADEALAVSKGNPLLEEISQEYEDFCLSMGLYPPTKSWMKVFAARETLSENLKYNMYYRNIETSHMFNGYDFIGMYRDKAIRGVGKVRGYIDAVRREEDETTGYDGWEVSVSEKLREAPDLADRIADLKQMAEDSPYDISWHPHRYVIVDAFHPTNMPKTTSGGIMGPRVFDLLDFENVTHEALESPSSKALVEALNGQTWG